MYHPILLTLLKMRPRDSQSSRENATPSSGTSPVASYKEVPPTPRGSIAQALELQMKWIIYEFCYLAEQWPLTELLYPTRHFNFFGINISIKGSCVSTKKIQVPPGIFHGIPFESDRRGSTCRNGQITENVRNTRFDFPRGYQPISGRISEDILFKQ